MIPSTNSLALFFRLLLSNRLSLMTIQIPFSWQYSEYWMNITPSNFSILFARNFVFNWIWFDVKAQSASSAMRWLFPLHKRIATYFRFIYGRKRRQIFYGNDTSNSHYLNELDHRSTPDIWCIVNFLFFFCSNIPIQFQWIENETKWFFVIEWKRKFSFIM